MRRSPLLPLSLTVFIDMLGLSIILPVLPYYAVRYGGGNLAKVGDRLSKQILVRLGNGRKTSPVRMTD